MQKRLTMQHHWAISITTLILLLIVMGVSLGFSLGAMITMVFIGHISLIWMVIAILKAPYSSKKTFDTHFYEDRE